MRCTDIKVIEKLYDKFTSRMCAVGMSDVGVAQMLHDLQFATTDIVANKLQGDIGVVSILHSGPSLAYAGYRIATDAQLVPGQPDGRISTPPELVENQISAIREYVPVLYWEINPCQVIVRIFRLNCAHILSLSALGICSQLGEREECRATK